jgi:RHS repeat-associated protein
MALVSDLSTSLKFWFHQSGWDATLKQTFSGQKKPDRKPQEKQKDRDARVARIEIYPGNVAVQVDERVAFTTVAFDQNGAPVGGVRVKWSCQDEDRNRAARVSQRGEFVATIPGKFKVTAETEGGMRAHVKVTVKEGATRRRNDMPERTREVSTRDLPPVAVAQSTKEDSEQKSTHASSSRKARKASRAHAATGNAAAAMPLPDDGWNDSNYLSADDPGNGVGNPLGGAMDEGAGSGNFQMAAPVLGLPGRGIDISLGLAYNSRLWNKAGSQISFDNDRGWPAPGWSLGFGKLLGMGVYNGGMIVDADGTRHGYSGEVTPYNWGTTFVGHTTDGTFIDYSYTSGTGGGIVFAQAKLPNGTVINYGAPGPGAVYPTSIEDPNGNYITITYVNNSGPRIQTIVDTLNRPINFYYDANDLLTAITGPGLNNSVRTLVRLHYRQLPLNYSFSGLTPVVRESNPWVIDAIYYPGTNTGYWFGDSDSYSTYGMLAKVSERRNMTLSSSSLNEQGTITSAGDITREEVYSYPLTTSDPGGSGLTDAPTYSSLTESWTRDGVNTDQAVTNYSSQPNANPRTVTITLPNGTKSVQYSNNAPGSFLDGLVFQDQTLDSGNNVLQSSSVSWAQGAYDSPRPTRVEATNERLQMTATEFSYGSVYNQVTEVRNYDYGGTTLLRATRTQYQNSANYTNRHIFNLPLVVEVFASDGVTRVSRTDYQYDGQTLTNTTGVVMHDDASNPYAPDQWFEPGGCCEYDAQDNCIQYCGGYYWNPYVPATDYRGNVTQMTTYANAGAEPASGAITETRRYDITGNLVTASTSCCEQTSFNYTMDTQYAYPLSQTRGSATDPYAQVTTSATYDFNTGLVLSATDANGRTSQTSYFAETLRPQTASLPSGAHTDYGYDDSAMTVTEMTYLESHPTHTTIADQNVKLLNGRGQVRQEKALGANGVWDFVDVVYDNMGRVSQQSRPYRTGDTLQWSSSVYDALSRVVSVQAPDGSTSQSFYNEVAKPDVASSAHGETTRVRDAWGRERWGRTDAQGRLVEVVEPNPSGSGSVFDTGALLTTYTYNTLGNLTTTTQDVQTRSFKYDSLGRLIAQKLAETNATLNDAGTYQTSGGTWSDVFSYDDRSNLISRTDARGVKTLYNFNNDPLNRLQSVAWDTSGFGDTLNPILPAATVTYQYRTKSSGSQLLDVTQPTGVTTTGISTESYSYDSEDRISSKTLTLTSRPSYPFVTDYLFDTLDRITDVRYPAEYGNGTQPRKVIHHDYDVASRLSGLTVDGAAHASQIVYNAASQITSLKVGLSGTNQITENYAYNSQTGLLDNQTVVRGGATTLLNLSYDYAGANGKRTGQLTKITNNLDTSSNHNRSYNYDALGRLVQATGGPFAAPLWSQTYTYDRYGNRTSVTASGNTARLQKPVEPKPQLPTDLLAFNSGGTLDPASLFGTDRSDVSDASSGLRLPLKREATATTKTSATLAPQGTPVFTDDPLTAEVTIKAVHITELRDAVNQARALAGLGAASWAESVTSGVTIKAAHIVELRTRLGEARAALGLSAASYTDPNLTAGITVKAAHVQELRDRVREALAGDGSCPPGQNLATDQFVKNFYQGALARQPNSAELQSWASQLRQAYYQGQAQQLATAQYMGRQLFKSQEYANRNRDDHQYVYDLYKAYLQREPDQAGWDSWTADVAQNGRDHTRLAFEVSLEFANKVASLCPGSGGSAPVPLDGLANLSYDSTTNRIMTTGFSYDAAGNQTRIVRGDGSAQKFQYDAANRLVKVTDDYAYTIATYTYGESNERLIAEEGGLRTYYVCDGRAEYMESGSSTTPQWSKSYIYLGARLLSTLTPNGSGGEFVQYHHPDRLGTRLVTNAQDTTYFEQVSLPFGTALTAESTGATNRRFTTYDRSVNTGLDYALNRHYDSQQGRFTQVDPAGMKAASVLNPQTLNLYAYCTNDPINHTDPSGLGFFSFLKKAFNWIKSHWKIILVAVVVAVAVLLIPGAPGFLWSSFQQIGHVIISGGVIVEGGGGISATLKIILGAGIAGAIAGLGTLLQQKKQSMWEKSEDKTFDRLEKLLKKGGACAEFLGAYGLDALNAMRNASRFTRSSGPGNNPTGISMDLQPLNGNFRAPTSVTFFTNGPFFVGVNKPALGTFPAGSNGAQLVALMHELGHLVKNPNGTGPLLPNDGGNSALSQTNTDTMLNYRGKNGKTCKEEIFDAK